MARLDLVSCATINFILALLASTAVAVPVANGPDKDCIDVAVIGGGIGGAYTAWRLRDRGLSISVFEYTDRVGGRLMTKDFPAAPGTFLEFGGMRFREDAHPILTRTATELGLKIIPFPLGYGNYPDQIIWHMRGKRLRNTDLGTSNMPYNLAPGELTDPATLIWNTFNNNVNLSSNTYPSLDEMYTLMTEDGTPLYKMSMDAFYRRYVSREAYNYIHDTSGWADSVGPLGALHGLKYYAVYPGDTGPYEPYKTIEGGMELVPRTLMEQFLKASSSHQLQLNRKLVTIENRPKGGYFLWLKQTKTIDGITSLVKGSDMRICAKKVILAAQKRCIQDIDFPVFKSSDDINENLNSVLDYPAGKIFLAYQTQWWKNGNADITHTKSDLPNRQSYDWQTGSNNVSIIMASYHDGDLVRYWRELSRIGRPILGSLPGANGVSEEVKRHVEKYLASIFDIKPEDIPEVVGGGMMLWDSFPYNAAWNLFKPGHDERIVRAALAKPSASDEVYIVSNSWARDELQAWCEGSLISADNVINKYF